jgi:hypothetical protein
VKKITCRYFCGNACIAVRDCYQSAIAVRESTSIVTSVEEVTRGALILLAIARRLE